MWHTPLTSTPLEREGKIPWELRVWNVVFVISYQSLIPNFLVLAACCLMLSMTHYRPPQPPETTYHPPPTSHIITMWPSTCLMRAWWFMAHGSGLTRLMAQASPPWPRAMSLEPWIISHEPRALSHEQSSMRHALSNMASWQDGYYPLPTYYLKCKNRKTENYSIHQSILSVI